MIQTITLIGAGNLATQLGKTLVKEGIKVIQVYSRTEKSAMQLALQLNTVYTTSVREINLTSDLLLIALKDDAIDGLLQQLDCRKNLLVHTAGSVSVDVLKKYSKEYGVFYPLQTFSKDRDVDFSNVPICIEGNSDKVINYLRELAGKISQNIYELNSEQRKTLHVAAVFVNNFVNHFYYLGDKILNKEGISFDILKPLILETSAKIQNMRPFDAQTGPARRFDETVINKHIELLEKQPDLQEIYSFVSESIYKAHKQIEK